MTGMTTTSSFEVEEYLHAVQAALADLPAETREDLIEDLPDHLAEVLAEGGSLRDRLGDPAEYAAELRSAAGLDVVDARRRSASMTDVVRGLGVRLERVDLGAGRLFGYARAGDLVRALQPGWWVLRGWLVTQLICIVQGSSEWKGVVPRYSGSRAIGAAILVVAIIVSVAVGRRSLRAGAWPRGVLTVISLAVLVWGIAVLPGKVAAHGSSGTMSIEPIGDDITDMYVYDSTGKPVPNARIYDQNGNPVQLGNPYCVDGSVSSAIPTDGSYGPGADDPTQQAWTYPLCPSVPGPFRSGPGSLPSGLATPTPVPPSSH